MLIGPPPCQRGRLAVAQAQAIGFVVHSGSSIVRWHVGYSPKVALRAGFKQFRFHGDVPLAVWRAVLGAAEWTRATLRMHRVSAVL